MLVIDPEFMQLLPMSTKEELETLEKSLLAEGCRDPLIVTSQGTVIDGMTRFVICQKRGIKFETVVKDFPNRKAARLWILENQLGRRNLTDAQRISIAENYLREGQLALGPKSIARTAEVSETTAKRFKRADTSPVKELGRMMRAGEVSIDAAAKVAELPKQKQERIIVRGASAVKAAAAKVREGKVEPPSIESPFPESILVDDALSAVTKLKNILTQLLGDVGNDREGDQCGFHMRPHRQEWPKQLDAMRFVLKHYRPYAVCPYCEGKAKGCRGCNGIGWVGQDTFDKAPKDMQAKTKGTIQ